MLHHLDQFEFCRLLLRLDLLSSVELPSFATLRLRRDLRRAARHVLGYGPAFATLFDPPVPGDPLGARRHQRPGPAFVLLPIPDHPGRLEVGGELMVNLHLFGNGIRNLAEFLTCLEELGRYGLWQGDGRFEIGAVSAVDPSGTEVRLPAVGQKVDSCLPIISARWFLDSLPAAPAWRLVLATPARLLVGGRPLFRGNLQRIFPFILRRVTSMAHAHCGIDLVEDPRLLREFAEALAISETRLGWQDWRSLDAPTGSVDLGGLTGSVTFNTPVEEDLLALLHLGSLLGIGKGAAYGGGNYHLQPAGVG